MKIAEECEGDRFDADRSGVQEFCAMAGLVGRRGSVALIADRDNPDRRKLKLRC